MSLIPMSDAYNQSGKDPQLEQNLMFGNKSIQRLILTCHKQGERTVLPDKSVIDSNYAHPSDAFPQSVHVKNEIGLHFADSLNVTIIGHGLGSDADLLDKIPSKHINSVNTFSYSLEDGDKMLGRATKVFRKEDIRFSKLKYDR